MFKYLILFTSLYIAGLMAPYLIFVAGAFAIAFVAKPYIPVAVAVLIDIQFGFVDGYILWYVLAALAAAMTVEILRPYLNIEQQS